jgi:Predicted membrane protein
MEERNNLPGNKVNISTQKKLGGIGAILMVVIFIPLIPIAGSVVLIVSLYQISRMVKKPSIFNKFIIGFVLGIIGDILLFFFGLGSFMGGRINFWITLVPAYILSIVGFYFCKQAFDMLAKTINHKLFSTAGIIMFIGAITTIILFLGGILLFASWIILAVAFFTAPEEVDVG